MADRAGAIRRVHVHPSDIRTETVAYPGVEKSGQISGFLSYILKGTILAWPAAFNTFFFVDVSFRTHLFRPLWPVAGQRLQTTASCVTIETKANVFPKPSSAAIEGISDTRTLDLQVEVYRDLWSGERPFRHAENLHQGNTEPVPMKLGVLGTTGVPPKFFQALPILTVGSELLELVGLLPNAFFSLARSTGTGF